MAHGIHHSTRKQSRTAEYSREGTVETLWGHQGLVTAKYKKELQLRGKKEKKRRDKDGKKKVRQRKRGGTYKMWQENIA